MSRLRNIGRIALAPLKALGGGVGEVLSHTALGLDKGLSRFTLGPPGSTISSRAGGWLVRHPNAAWYNPLKMGALGLSVLMFDPDHAIEAWHNEQKQRRRIAVTRVKRVLKRGNVEVYTDEKDHEDLG